MTQRSHAAATVSTQDVYQTHQRRDTSPLHTKSHLVAIESSYVGLETELYQQLDCRDPKASF